jgi:hypothetical protein
VDSLDPRGEVVTVLTKSRKVEVAMTPTRIRIRTVAALALVIAAHAGCGRGPLEPDPVRLGEPIQTDRVRYAARVVRGSGPPTEYAFTAVASYTNESSSDVHLDRCFAHSEGPLHHVVMAGSASGRTSAYSGFWACVDHDDPIVVRAGATRVDTLRLTAPQGWDPQTRTPAGEMAGPMRLAYPARVCPRPGECTRIDAIQSNVFVVERRR